MNQISDGALLMYVILFGIIFFIGVLITRYIFKVETMVRHQKNTVELLKLIAEKNGATEKEITNAIAGEVSEYRKELEDSIKEVETK